MRLIPHAPYFRPAVASAQKPLQSLEFHRRWTWWARVKQEDGLLQYPNLVADLTGIAGSGDVRWVRCEMPVHPPSFRVLQLAVRLIRIAPFAPRGKPCALVAQPGVPLHPETVPEFRFTSPCGAP